MKLEEFPEFNKGAIAEIGFIQPDCLGRFVGEPQFRLFYLDEIVRIEEMSHFGEGPASYRRVDGESSRGNRVFAALRVIERKYQREDGEYRIFHNLDGVAINMEAIVSFKLLEYKSSKK